MGTRYRSISDADRAFIAAQSLFFVATAATDSSINLSPKGADSLRVQAPDRVLWLNFTGSGNETAAHLRADGRITLMFCAFAGDPLILRLYGRARAIHPRDDDWAALREQFGEFPSARQLIDCHIEAVQRSCGFTVPLMQWQGEREQMSAWIERKRAEPGGLERYWAQRNARSIDGLPTGTTVDAEP